MTSEASSTERIRSLNDAFRRSFTGCRVMMTSGIAALPGRDVHAIQLKVRLFDAFNAANDPYGVHDHGSFEHGGNRICFKIDYYDKNIECGREDPADSSKTTRVLTVMLAIER